MNTTLTQNLPRSKDVQNDGVDPQLSAAPAVKPLEPPRHEGSQREAEGVAVSCDSDGRDDAERRGDRSPRTIQNTPIVNRPASAVQSKDSLWEQARDLISYDEYFDSTADQLRLGQTIHSMEKIISRHAESKNCPVCNCMKNFTDGELDVNRLECNLETATQSEKEIAIKKHLPPPDPRMRFRSERSSVDFVLEKRERWSAIRLQEFHMDAEALELWPRRPLPDLFGDSQPATEEPALRKEYRQHARDVCVLVPFQEGKHGFARELTERVNVEVIRLWLSYCGNKHHLCSQQISDSYPPGFILIDAVKMCLVPVAPHNSVRYIALSYVWGDISQPTLTKAVLETWLSDGQLRDVEIPRTISDAIELVQMIRYRYIWVDALCIVQDDLESRHGQISQMHEIYRQADLTIVAADGDNCSAGLPGVTLDRARMYKHRRYELPGFYFMKVPSSTKHIIEMAPWRTRGWTFQEELCSRRTLVLLPDVMFFSCASAVWREDIQLEAEDTLPRSEEGLMSLASMLHQKNPGHHQELLALFRDLVKKYMQRTLNRTDDMENAFAGVAGILEPLIGPAYHGIPERMFDEVIQGCWFWDTSLQRRAGFPSWSWTGWIYRREQADVGIRPLSTASNMSKLLEFYKVGPSGIGLLGNTGFTRHTGGEFLPRMDAELRSHFIPNEDDIKSKNEFLHQGEFSGNLIAFYTSVSYLRLRALPGDLVGTSREYRVFHPQTNRQLTSIHLKVAYVAQKGTMLPFIVADHDPDRRSFRLMLISMEGSTVERVNVTSQGRRVKEDDWKDVGPKKELVFMS